MQPQDSIPNTAKIPTNVVDHDVEDDYRAVEVPIVGQMNPPGKSFQPDGFNDDFTKFVKPGGISGQ